VAANLRIERDGHVLRITLARPDRRNAFDAALIAELAEAFVDVGRARAVVLAGDGPSFCAGADVDWMRSSAELSYDENVADDIEQKLRKGVPFENLSAQYSLAPNAKKGGEIGYVGRGDLPKMFEDEIFALKPGTVSGVIRTDSSFHIFRVDERRSPGVIDMQTASPVIRERLKEEEVRTRMAELVGKAKKEISVTVLTKRLPFRYTGTLAKSENE